MTETVLLAREDAVARVTLNRPARYNALDDVMMRKLRAVLAEVAADDTVRAVLLEGAGPAFTAGGDVAMFHSRLGKEDDGITLAGDDFHGSIRLLRGMPKPVVASVHGVAAGGGLSVMLACDLAIASESAQFTLAYASIGASPDGGSTWFLPRIVGLRRALDLVMRPEPFGAVRALELGLVNEVVPASELAARAMAVAQALSRGPTLAYARAKVLLDAAFDRPFTEHLDHEIQTFARTAKSADFAEGVTAFVEKRKPRFQGR